MQLRWIQGTAVLVTEEQAGRGITGGGMTGKLGQGQGRRSLGIVQDTDG